MFSNKKKEDVIMKKIQLAIVVLVAIACMVTLFCLYKPTVSADTTTGKIIATATETTTQTSPQTEPTSATTQTTPQTEPTSATTLEESVNDADDYVEEEANESWDSEQAGTAIWSDFDSNENHEIVLPAPTTTEPTVKVETEGSTNQVIVIPPDDYTIPQIEDDKDEEVPPETLSTEPSEPETIPDSTFETEPTAPSETETTTPSETEPTEIEEHHYAEIQQGGVLYVYVSHVKTPYVDGKTKYFPWDFYPF